MTTSDADKRVQIAQLNTQISNLQKQISTLQTTITLNTNTINSLNAQITSYQTQIANLQNQIAQNSAGVKEYTDKIAELEKTVAYLQNYVNSTASENQSIVQFYFDGSLYNVQVVNNGNTALVSNPTSTDYVIFNYWKRNDVQTDPSTTPITEDTTFIADVTYKYDVKFMLDNSTYNSQIVTEGENPTKPATDPTKEGYTFLGWSLNGVDVVDPTTVTVEDDTTFTALFVQMFTVTFNDGTSQTTQSAQNGSYATKPTDPEKEGYIFKGWTIDGTNIIDPTTIVITQDTTFMALFTELFTVTFNDGTSQTTQSVENGGYATKPTDPTKEGYTFLGWSLNGVDVIDPATVTIEEDTTFTALFVQVYTVSFIVDEDVCSTQSVTKGDYPILPIMPSKYGYDFIGWSIDGVNIVEDYSIIGDTIYKALFKRNIDGNYTVTCSGYYTYKFSVNNGIFEEKSISLNGNSNLSLIVNFTDDTLSITLQSYVAGVGNLALDTVTYTFNDGTWNLTNSSNGFNSYYSFDCSLS